MKESNAKRGSIVVFFAIAIFVIAALSVGLSTTSSISTLNQLEFNQANSARNLAYSGLEYAKGLKAVYENDKAFSDYRKAIEGQGQGQGQVSLGDDVGTFTISILNPTISGTTTTYSISVLGETPAGPFQARYQLADATPLTYEEKEEKDAPGNPRVPTSLAAPSIDLGGDTATGDFIASEYSFNGGVKVYGSIDYVNTEGDCLILTGNAFGKSDGSSHICSNTCIEIKTGTQPVYSEIFSQGDVIISNAQNIRADIHAGGDVKITNGNGVYGDIYATGNVVISNGTVEGDIHAGSDVWLSSWSAKVTGDIYVHGNYINSISDKLMEGAVYYNQPAPSAPSMCNSYALPEHEVVPATAAFNLGWSAPNYGKFTFFGSSDIDDHSYAYTSMSSSGGTAICFDLSVPNTYINIFSGGNMNIGGDDLYVRTSTDTDCFDKGNLVETTDFAYSEYASRVYMDIRGDVSFNGGAFWLGTIYALGTLTIEEGIIGAAYSNEKLTMGGGSDYKFVASDYATKNW